MIHPQSSPKSIAERIARAWWDDALRSEMPSLATWHGATGKDRAAAIAEVQRLLDAIHAAGLAIVEAADGR
jgi:hypothetical protein